MKSSISRRAFLRGTGAAITLPFLDSLAPRTFAAEKTISAPKRLVFVNFPLGVSKENWFIPELGGKLSAGMAPLEPFRKHFSILENLQNKNAHDVHDSSSTWLTGANTRLTPGRAYHNSISCDQIAAAQLGAETRFTSLEVSSESTNHSPSWGEGRSLASNATGSSIPAVNNPVMLFNRLFGTGDYSFEQRKNNLLDGKSVLDAVMTDAKSLHKKVATEDKEKVDQYFQSIREIELRLAKEEQWLNKPQLKPSMKPPEDLIISGSSKEFIMNYDLMTAALQADLTRVMTYRLSVDGLLEELQIKGGIHSLNHYNGPDSEESAKRRDIAQTKALAHFLKKLSETKDVNGGTLLDNSIIVYGSAVRVVHILNNLPTLVAGGVNTGIKQGQHLAFKDGETPLSNLWLTLLQHVGIQTESFSDSNGSLGEILA